MECLIVDIIKNTLAICYYSNCSMECSNYLLAVGKECPVVFNNHEYLTLWNTLFKFCSDLNLSSH